MTVVLDAGALLAVERRDPRFGAYLREAQRRRVPVRTSTTVVAQAWRGGSRQAELARQLPAVDQVSVTSETARAIGVLLGTSGSSDVVDGHVALLCSPGDVIVTSDTGDIQRLLDVRGVAANVVPV